MTKFSKAIWAFLSTLIASLSVAVAAADPHTITAIHTPAWLTIAGALLTVTGGVYGLTNQP